MQHNSSLSSFSIKIVRNTLLFISILTITELSALPVLDNVSNGEAAFVQGAGEPALQINQVSDKAIINWQSFNISLNEAVRFQQPANGVCLNRINPMNGLSHIDG